MTRSPRTPDCGIEGCTRAAYRQDLCRQHYAMLDLETNLLRASSHMIRAHEEAKAARAAVVASVQAKIDGEAA